MPTAAGTRRRTIGCVDPFNLERFVVAQQGVYGGVVHELRMARKTTHWMWFVFPQLAGLGRSWVAEQYAIGSLDEARAYLAQPVLGTRLRECASILLLAPVDATPHSIFGATDALKLRSSMTLFLRAAPDEALWQHVLDRFYGGTPDARTDELLGLG